MKEALERANNGKPVVINKARLKVAIRLLMVGFVVGALVGYATAARADGPGVMACQPHGPYADASVLSFLNDDELAQGFEVDDATVVAVVVLNVFQQAGLNGAVVVEIRDDDDGEPGAVIGTATRNASTLRTSAAALNCEGGGEPAQMWAFDPPVEVDASTAYYWSIRLEDSTQGLLYSRLMDGNPYTAGARWESDDAGATWTETPELDLSFVLLSFLPGVPVSAWDAVDDVLGLLGLAGNDMTVFAFGVLLVGLGTVVPLALGAGPVSVVLGLVVFVGVSWAGWIPPAVILGVTLGGLLAGLVVFGLGRTGQ